MADAVENASIIIPFMTEQYQQSKACNQEIEYANDIGVTVVPIRALDKTSDGKSYRARGRLGIICAGKLYVDFTDESVFDAKMEELFINIGFALMDPDAVMKLVREGKSESEEQELDGSDKRVPIQVFTKDMQLDSRKRGYTETQLDGPVLSISLLKQDSTSDVVQGISFGFIGNRVWVDNGARGMFRVVYTTSRSVKVVEDKNEGEKQRMVQLQSFEYKRKERVMDRKVKEMVLVTQLSRSACILDESFGFHESTVWVDRGARGLFKIIYE